MAKTPRKSLSKPRQKAFLRQQGRCFYCQQPMWLDDPHSFAQLHGLTTRQAQLLQCTGEHLVAHSEGGGANAANIVAACFHCNQRRHNRKSAPDPESYRRLVMRRMAKNGWLPFRPMEATM